MNSLSFLKLLHMIYSKNKKLPDLNWIQRQGLLAVKLGQVHALRIDFLDKDKCIHLTKLYRQNMTLPAQDFNNLLHLYAPQLREHFSSIEKTPLASASVGQVHRASLKNKQPVVIKLIKKDVRHSFLQDVQKIQNLFRMVTFFYPPIKQVGNPIGILDDIKDYTLSELDLDNEVQGQQVLRNIYNEHKNKFNLSNMAFPEIYPELSNQNIMVSEFIKGKTFDELLDAGQMDYNQLLELFHIHGFFLFIIGTFHGDIHPGNIMLHNNKIVFIDTGYIGHVGAKIRKGLFNFFDALSDYDYPRCAKHLNDMSEIEITGQTFKAFESKFIDLYQEFTNSTVRQVSLTKKMMQTIKLGVHSGMSFEKGIFAIIRSLMYLDGMVLRCNPDAILLKDMKRFIGEFKPLI